MRADVRMEKRSGDCTGSKEYSQAMHSISIYPCPLVGLGSSLCEFDSKDQVAVAIYVTMAVSVEKDISCFVFG